MSELSLLGMRSNNGNQKVTYFYIPMIIIGFLYDKIIDIINDVGINYISHQYVSDYKICHNEQIPGICSWKLFQCFILIKHYH